MSAPAMYPRAPHPTRLTERCRAEVTVRGVGLVRCANQVSPMHGGMCWRHR